MDAAYFFNIDLWREYSTRSETGETCASHIILSAAVIDKLGNTRRRRTESPESRALRERATRHMKCSGAIIRNLAGVDLR